MQGITVGTEAPRGATVSWCHPGQERCPCSHTLLSPRLKPESQGLSRAFVFLFPSNYAGAGWGWGSDRLGTAGEARLGPPCPGCPSPVLCVLPFPHQAYAMMLSLSEDTPLHAPSQSSLDAWLNITGASSESGAFNPINHL